MDVALVVMPFGIIQRPSLGVSLLKASLSKNQISSKIYYFNLDLARMIGFKLYSKIAGHSSLLGEYLFSRTAFDSKQWNTEELKHFVKKYTDESSLELIQQLARIKEDIPCFIEECAEKVLSENPKIIGFSSIFHQNCASISVARKIKEKSSAQIIFGGANCENEMGAALLKCVPDIDFVCSGEGDKSFIEFTKLFLQNMNAKVQGIITSQSSELEKYLTQPILDMDSLPIPDFDEYYKKIKDLSLEEIQPKCTMETSRGCWWGEKHQCTFCGLNGATMNFRSKSVQRCLTEIKYLKRKYDIKNIYVVDNILDLRYINSLFPELEKEEIGVQFFYETKSNLSKQQLIQMKNTGVNYLQPGIESLSDKILKIMEKGVTGLQNIQLLKWCRELNINAYWNLLYGFPEEPYDEYDKMAGMVPLLTHIKPPSGIFQISLDRFSPYFINPKFYGLTNVRPRQDYYDVYPFADQDIRSLAYHFDFDYEEDRYPFQYVTKLRNEISAWSNKWKQEAPVLVAISTDDENLYIHDTRDCRKNTKDLLRDQTALIYRICDSVHSFNSIYMKIKSTFPNMDKTMLLSELESLINRKIMISYDNNYLSLANTFK
ncbi:Ribosomal protein S12 methylthiotransferase RimO [Candidatus Nitrosocosmicus oleophilus]|uniref:Ribosomal protein S12 methylthiotransferase RimO n=1 Tax=Candidatus Nitrosocosmicus oleophilus TaxID=1353260 RepID=A0A654M2I3_9ARCH|nr:RiPP maturation radical SAM C-methyltransferase [Candidatus Nitrosocosmicus oleophilus]ALI36866.1 Ribosomal protein S12 methylthiotransferase RimO [Candidatus Nitrosocosmicus oleophilus]